MSPWRLRRFHHGGVVPWIIWCHRILSWVRKSTCQIKLVAYYTDSDPCQIYSMNVTNLRIPDLLESRGKIFKYQSYQGCSGNAHRTALTILSTSLTLSKDPGWWKYRTMNSVYIKELNPRIMSHKIKSQCHKYTGSNSFPKLNITSRPPTYSPGRITRLSFLR